MKASGLIFTVVGMLVTMSSASAQTYRSRSWSGSSAVNYDNLDSQKGADISTSIAYWHCAYGNLMATSGGHLGSYAMDYSALTRRHSSSVASQDGWDLFISRQPTLGQGTPGQLSRLQFPGNTSFSWDSSTALSSGRTSFSEFSWLGYTVGLFRYLHFREDQISSLSSATTRIAVLINGWNRTNETNPYDNSELQACYSNLSAVLGGSGWEVIPYDWAADAATGGADLGGNATEAAETAVWHGRHLAQRLTARCPNLKKVHFIAHSAGSWIARTAARNILLQNSTVRVQVTLLDPFMPNELLTNASYLGEPLMSELDGVSGGGRLYLLENYYSISWNNDLTFGTQEVFSWRQGDVNQRVDTGSGHSAYANHQGPVQFYADTVKVTRPGEGTVPALADFNLLNVGWKRSLFYNDLKSVSVAADTTALAPGGSTTIRSQIATNGGTDLSRLKPRYAWYRGTSADSLVEVLNTELESGRDTQTGALSQTTYFKLRVTDQSTGDARESAVVAVSVNATPTRVIGLSGDLNFGFVVVGTSAQRTLTVSNTGNSALNVTGIQLPGGFNGNWTGTIAAGGSQNVTITFTPAGLTDYGGSVAVTSNATSGTNTRAISGSGSTVLPNYTLSLTAVNGSISRSPAQSSYLPGTQVTLIANPSSGYAFSNWTGDLSGSANPTTITMNGSKSITANFRVVDTAALHVSIESYNLPGSGSGSGSFFIRNDGHGVLNWTAVSSAPWLTVLSSGGTINIQGGQNWLDYSFVQNTTGAPRTATITVSASGAVGSPKTVTFVQDNNSPPGFSAHPTDRVVMAGESVSFAVNVSGVPQPTLRWQMRTGPTGDWGDVPTAIPFSGESTSMLTITNVPADFNGRQFRCVASNFIHTGVPSQPATLVVQSAERLLAYWTFNQGDARDESGSLNHGVASNEVLFAPGLLGGAAYFDGTSAKIDVVDFPGLVANRRTVCLWVRQDTVRRQYQDILSKHSDESDCEYLIRSAADGKYDFNWNIGGSFYDGSVGGIGNDDLGLIQPRANQWDFLVLTHDGTVIRFYHNAALVWTGAASGDLVDSANILRLGGYAFDGTNAFRGGLDEVRIYSYALDAAAIQSLYSDGVAMMPQIMMQPQPVAVPRGQSALFQAQAVGAVAPSLRWQVSSNAGLTWTDLQNAPPYAGVDTALLTISAVARDMDGHRFRLAAHSSAGEVFSDPASLTVLESFDEWRAQSFAGEELSNTSLSGPNADPDGDGWPNLAEYAVGTDPRNSDDAGDSSAGYVDGLWTYTYTRPRDRNDITYEVEFSFDLVTWTTQGLDHARIQTGSVSEVWRARVPASESSTIFFRIRVVRND